ncbi:unnamed protein product, partial [Symbiodinium pilosum]
QGKLLADEVYYWALELDANSSAVLASLWESVPDYQEAKTSGLVMKDEYHVTLLFIGGASDEELAARNPKLAGTDIHALREEFHRRQGERLPVTTGEFVWEEGRIGAAPVDLGSFYSKCANVHPHMTLGMAAGVGAEKSNELLARLDASRDFNAGLGQWLFQLHVSKYGAKIARYCKAEGIESPEELSQRALEVAVAVEPDAAAAEELAAVLGNATNGALHEHKLDTGFEKPIWAMSATDAGVRLFEMIRLAKERSDQRRELSDATEEVREQARALEELLALEQISMARAEYVEAI